MVLAVGEILFEIIPGTVFAHVLVLLCLKCMLGPDHSHATGQSQGQSQKTQSHDQTNDPRPANERMTTMTKQSTNMPNVHTVMTPMSQPVGGWHVTSMTRQPGTIMSMHELHDQTDKTIG